MKGNRCLVNLVLLIAMTGSLALTASTYVDCKDFYPDEFLDLGLLCQHPILPVFTPHLNTYPSKLFSVKISDSQKLEFLSTVLRF